MSSLKNVKLIIYFNAMCTCIIFFVISDKRWTEYKQCWITSRVVAPYNTVLMQYTTVANILKYVELIIYFH